MAFILSLKSRSYKDIFDQRYCRGCCNNHRSFEHCDDCERMLTKIRNPAIVAALLKTIADNQHKDSRNWVSRVPWVRLLTSKEVTLVIKFYNGLAPLSTVVHLMRSHKPRVLGSIAGMTEWTVHMRLKPSYLLAISGEIPFFLNSSRIIEVYGRSVSKSVEIGSHLVHVRMCAMIECGRSLVFRLDDGSYVHTDNAYFTGDSIIKESDLPLHHATFVRVSSKPDDWEWETLEDDKIPAISSEEITSRYADEIMQNILRQRVEMSEIVERFYNL